MKKLLLALTVLMVFMLVGCGGFGNRNSCGLGEYLVEGEVINYCMPLEDYKPTTTETTTTDITTTDYHNDLEQILYDILIIEYATNLCTRDELNDYAEAYLNEVEIYSGRIETMLEMIDQQLDGE